MLKQLIKPRRWRNADGVIKVWYQALQTFDYMCPCGWKRFGLQAVKLSNYHPVYCKCCGRHLYGKPLKPFNKAQEEQRRRNQILTGTLKPKS